MHEAVSILWMVLGPNITVIHMFIVHLDFAYYLLTVKINKKFSFNISFNSIRKYMKVDIELYKIHKKLKK